MNRAVVYFPYPVFPACSGGQWRCISILRALVDFGYDVILITPGTITPAGQDAADDLGINSWMTPIAPSLSKLLIGKLVRKIFRTQLKTGSTDKGLLRLLHEVRDQHASFDLVLINYSNNQWAKQFLRSNHSILETHDLISVSEQMNSLAKSHVTFSGRKIVKYKPIFLSLEFFKNIKIQPTLKESGECCGYDVVLVIAEKEDAAIRRGAPGLNTVVLPPSASVVERFGDYEGNPIFASGPNIFNLQGLLGFQEKILPTILSFTPDFRMNVTGNLFYEMKFHERVSYLGLVPDIHDVYQKSGFAIVPTFGGTGQQLKVVEAMGAGLAVVAYAQRIDAGIIDDGIDGFLCVNEADFAAKTLLLWSDTDLRRKMGIAAREKILRCYSQEVTNRRMRDLLLSSLSVSAHTEAS